MTADLEELRSIITLGREIDTAIATAKSSKQSLHGNGFYASKIQTLQNMVEIVERKIPTILHAHPSIVDTTIDGLVRCARILRDTTIPRVDRRAAVAETKRILEVDVAPVLHASGQTTTPKLHEVLPQAVYRPSRGYIEKIADQANGCYEHGWYDATAVLIRRLVETMIIEVYERPPIRTSKIQDGTGNYFGLDDLIRAVSNDSDVTLSRDTKRALPEIKTLGDRSAHNRRFIATKPDVDKVIPGLRVAANDLLHLAGLR